MFLPPLRDGFRDFRSTNVHDTSSDDAEALFCKEGSKPGPLKVPSKSFLEV